MTQTIIELAERIADRHGWQLNTTIDGDRMWVEYAAHIGGHPCEEQGGESGPMWDIVERGVVTGGAGTQCGMCGQYGQGYIESGAAEVTAGTGDEDGDAAVTTIESVFTARVDRALAAERERIGARLCSTLAEWLRMSAQDRLDSSLAGSEIEPGVYDTGGERWVAWDYDPDGSAATITVTITRDHA